MEHTEPKIILCTNDKEESNSLQVLVEELSNKNMKKLSSIGELTNWLLTSRTEQAVVILAVNKREEIDMVQPFIHLFRKVKIILLLPDREPETIKIGYKLEPRFLSFVDTGADMLKEVALSMFENLQKSTGKVKI
jgi:hypothetical protein